MLPVRDTGFGRRRHRRARCVLAAGLGPTGRIPSQADPRCELNDFLAGSVESPGEVLGKLAAHAWTKNWYEEEEG